MYITRLHEWYRARVKALTREDEFIDDLASTYKKNIKTLKPEADFGAVDDVKNTSHIHINPLMQHTNIEEQRYQNETNAVAHVVTEDTLVNKSEPVNTERWASVMAVDSDSDSIDEIEMPHVMRLQELPENSAMKASEPNLSSKWAPAVKVVVSKSTVHIPLELVVREIPGDDEPIAITLPIRSLSNLTSTRSLQLTSSSMPASTMSLDSMELVSAETTPSPHVSEVIGVLPRSSNMSLFQSLDSLDSGWKQAGNAGTKSLLSTVMSLDSLNSSREDPQPQAITDMDPKYLDTSGDHADVFESDEYDTSPIQKLVERRSSIRSQMDAIKTSIRVAQHMSISSEEGESEDESKDERNRRLTSGPKSSCESKIQSDDDDTSEVDWPLDDSGEVNIDVEYVSSSRRGSLSEAGHGIRTEVLQYISKDRDGSIVGDSSDSSSPLKYRGKGSEYEDDVLMGTSQLQGVHDSVLLDCSTADSGGPMTKVVEQDEEEDEDDEDFGEIITNIQWSMGRADPELIEIAQALEVSIQSLQFDIDAYGSCRVSAI
jgi:hypothetical protein